MSLSQAGGFHYDEAWAALFSNRIAAEPGFWPVAAMSPYTSAWSHYVAAAFFKLFGTDLFVYRASGIALVVAGVSLLSLALRNFGQALAGALLPWIIAFFSAAVINHRFTIEINTFHVFCFGLLSFGLSRKKTWTSDLAILLSVVLGVTSHVLFLAPALACLVVAFWNSTLIDETRHRKLAMVALFLLAGFFLRIFFGIPEKDKSGMLVLIATLSLLGVLFPFSATSLLQKIRKRFDRSIALVFLAATIVASFFLLFFSEGSWAAAFFNGGQSDLRVILWPVVALAIAGGFGWKKLRALANQNSKWAQAFTWGALTLILTASMATKPAPRYFEIPFLILACVFAIAIAQIPKRPAMLALTIWVVGGALQLDLNYLKPAIQGSVHERSFRFLFFRDNSSDTLSKQDLAHSLADAGCRFDDITSDDIRILDPLRFLSLGDWKLEKNTRCLFGSKVRVERRSRMIDPVPFSRPAGEFIVIGTKSL